MRAVVGRCLAECHGVAPTRASGCRHGICLMVEYRTGVDWARGGRSHGSGVIQSGGTGRAGRDGSCRAGGVRAGADHADHVCVGRTEAMWYVDWWRGAGGIRESWPGGCRWAGTGPASRVASICGAGWDARCGSSGRAAAGRAGRVGSVGSTERVMDDGRMPDGRLRQVAAGWGHVGRIMRGLDVPMGLQVRANGIPHGQQDQAGCGVLQMWRGSAYPEMGNQGPACGCGSHMSPGGGSLQRISRSLGLQSIQEGVKAVGPSLGSSLAC